MEGVIEQLADAGEVHRSRIGIRMLDNELGGAIELVFRHAEAFQ